MRIKRSLGLSFKLLALPAAAFSVVAYFEFYAIWGERGVLALESTEAKIGVSQAQLVLLEESSARIKHKISLMEQAAPDPDLVEELARGKLMLGELHQVTLPRLPH